MYLVKWKLTTAVLCVWAVFVYLLKSPHRCGDTTDAAVVKVQEQISSQLDTLRKQHSDLISRIRSHSRFIENNTKILKTSRGPVAEYEDLRRRIYSNTKELLYYVNHKLTMVMTGKLKLDKIQTVLDQVADIKRSLLSDQDKLSDLDGYQDWRQMEAAHVSDLVQRRLHYLQHPPDCKKARKLICSFMDCGFGCQLHQLVFCLIFAYATERTLILNSKTWQYSTKGWEHMFNLPYKTCTSIYNETARTWPVFYDAKVVDLRDTQYIFETNSLMPKFVPLAVPKDLAHRTARFNGDPASWWIAQMIKYILKPRASTQSTVNEIIAGMNFESPIVGIHIRRTDKLVNEAQLHHIDEYMKHVKDYYNQLELTQPVADRRVYLATDDPSVLEEIRKSYPDYLFVSDPSIAKMAAPRRRYSPQSLIGLLVDLDLLSRCNYIVCTMSSSVGRLAYELMQTNRVDASKSFYSLDDVYYYGGQNPHNRVAVMPNAGTDNTIPFAVDDIIGVAGNQWNGYGCSINGTTNAKSLFPWYKTADQLLLYPFPEYRQVPLYLDTRPDKLHNYWLHQTSNNSSEKLSDASFDISSSQDLFMS